MVDQDEMRHIDECVDAAYRGVLAAVPYGCDVWIEVWTDDGYWACRGTPPPDPEASDADEWYAAEVARLKDQAPA